MSVEWNSPHYKMTRNQEKYYVPFAYHNRLRDSAIPQMARQLNGQSDEETKFA